MKYVPSLSDKGENMIMDLTDHHYISAGLKIQHIQNVTKPGCLRNPVGLVTLQVFSKNLSPKLIILICKIEGKAQPFFLDATQKVQKRKVQKLLQLESFKFVSKLGSTRKIKFVSISEFIFLECKRSRCISYFCLEEMQRKTKCINYDSRQKKKKGGGHFEK